MIALVKRNIKEIIRDPLTLVFAILLPAFLLLIFQQFKIPSEVYKIENFTPSIIIFGYSFITLFTANLIAKDRTTSLLARLYASPLKPYQYVLGYTIALIPLALCQCVLFFTMALLLGLSFSVNILVTILIMLPLAILYISLGILIGCMTSDKAAPGVGSIVVQLVAFTSGMYFSIDEIGGIIKFISSVLPFSYSVNVARATLIDGLSNNVKDVIIVLAYLVIIFVLSSFVFKNKMISDNK